VLEAAHVEIVWFENSAHNACFEEPDRFQSELIDRVLAATG
jgi:pimeloyl-ACP methyl ester carboxylesterase